MISIGIADKVTLDAVKLETDKIAVIKSKTDLIMGKCQLFLANGTFVVPAGVYTVYLTGCAAGNTGAAGGGGAYDVGGAGGAGGEGGEVIFDFLIPNLTPGQSIAVTTGNGNTVFGSHLTLVKGGGAARGNGGSNNGSGSPGGKGGGSLIKGTPYNAGAGGAGGAAGGGTGTVAGSGGGGGGGGFSGAGGAGGAGAGVFSGDGHPGVIGTGYGSGGGGGGGGSPGAGGAGGAGSPGFLFVRWL